MFHADYSAWQTDWMLCNSTGKTDRNLQITPEEQEQTKLFVIHLKRDWNRFPVIQIRFL